MPGPFVILGFGTQKLRVLKPIYCADFRTLLPGRKKPVHMIVFRMFLKMIYPVAKGQPWLI